MEQYTRIAVVSEDKCKPKKCKQECKKCCPVVKIGKLCIEVSPQSKTSTISEQLCIGCGQCVKRCPFNAINIINLPKDLDRETTHRYGTNGFKLHRLPTPRPGQILGLVGNNGIGKSTALKILASKITPNLGILDKEIIWDDIITHFRGSELQNYFQRLINDKLKALIKPQHVDYIPKIVKGTVKTILQLKDEKGKIEEIVEMLELRDIMEREIKDLSGGELQRFAIAVTYLQKADVYIFDEPSSYLDIYQRLKIAKTVRSLLTNDNYIIVVEHDLAVLDYLSDFICCLYGVSGGYGVITLPFSVREGINIFLGGFVPTENLRFRDFALNFKLREQDDIKETDKHDVYHYPPMTKTFTDFKLTVETSNFTDSEIIVLLGRNGTGKTTFIRMLAGLTQSDSTSEAPKFKISYKPQMLSPTFEGTVRQLLHKKISSSFFHPQFITDVIKPLNIESLLDQKVKNLSGGEIQRVAITLCLGQPANIYLLDEPSAYLDSEQRILTSKIIKRFILHSRKTAFIVEHDFIMATYLADRVIVFDGQPSLNCTAHSPQNVVDGINVFLKQLDVTLRRDPTNFRPRINKSDSVKDREQKLSGNYFFLDE